MSHTTQIPPKFAVSWIQQYHKNGFSAHQIKSALKKSHDTVVKVGAIRTITDLIKTPKSKKSKDSLTPNQLLNRIRKYHHEGFNPTQIKAALKKDCNYLVLIGHIRKIVGRLREPDKKKPDKIEYSDGVRGLITKYIDQDLRVTQIQHRMRVNHNYQVSCKGIQQVMAEISAAPTKKKASPQQSSWMPSDTMQLIREYYVKAFTAPSAIQRHLRQVHGIKVTQKAIAEVIEQHKQESFPKKPEPKARPTSWNRNTEELIHKLHKPGVTSSIQIQKSLQMYYKLQVPLDLIEQVMVSGPTKDSGVKITDSAIQQTIEDYLDEGLETRQIWEKMRDDLKLNISYAEVFAGVEKAEEMMAKSDPESKVPAKKTARWVATRTTAEILRCHHRGLDTLSIRNLLHNKQCTVTPEYIEGAILAYADGRMYESLEASLLAPNDEKFEPAAKMPTPDQIAEKIIELYQGILRLEPDRLGKVGRIGHLMKCWGHPVGVDYIKEIMAAVDAGLDTVMTAVAGTVKLIQDYHKAGHGIESIFRRMRADDGISVSMSHVGEVVRAMTNPKVMTGTATVVIGDQEIPDVEVEIDMGSPETYPDIKDLIIQYRMNGHRVLEIHKLLQEKQKLRVSMDSIIKVVRDKFGEANSVLGLGSFDREYGSGYTPKSPHITDLEHERERSSKLQSRLIQTEGKLRQSEQKIVSLKLEMRALDQGMADLRTAKAQQFRMLTQQIHELCEKLRTHPEADAKLIHTVRDLLTAIEEHPAIDQTKVPRRARTHADPHAHTREFWKRFNDDAKQEKNARFWERYSSPVGPLAAGEPYPQFKMQETPYTLAFLKEIGLL